MTTRLEKARNTLIVSETFLEATKRMARMKFAKELIAQVEADRKEIYNQREEALKKGLKGKALALEWKLNGIDWYKSKFENLLRVEVE